MIYVVLIFIVYIIIDMATFGEYTPSVVTRDSLKMIWLIP